MLNIYPQRATNPNKIDSRCDQYIHNANLEHIKKYLSNFNEPKIWAAWGTSIEKRIFLIDCLTEIYNKSKQANAQWITFGKLTKKGHPRHPLYLPIKSKRCKFNIEKYIEKFI